jgi:transcriptional regulator with XRE-family HTH domain
MPSDVDAAGLRAWRSSRGLSRQQAADMLGINPRTLEGLEQGRYPGSPLWGPVSRLIELLDRISS